MELLEPFEKPLLSVVATSRNDDHGGDPLARTQIFIDSFLDQCREKELPAELILVEWNPPEDRPPLAEVLSFDHVNEYAVCRIFTVAPELHATLQHAAELPLYQMIAKNVGIRRARGEFVLATNIDILFSEELMEFAADRRFRVDRMYRVDRLDIESGVPAEAPWDAQLEYAWSHVIRENNTDGFVVDPEIRCRDLSSADIVPVELPANPHFEELHTMACGDFTLLSKKGWEALRGYPEFDCFSMHIDSVFCTQAHYAGYVQSFLPQPAACFHIEHSTGSGWSPEGEAAMYARIREKGIPDMSHHLYRDIAKKMRAAPEPWVFNTESWGLQEFEVGETVFALSALAEAMLRLLSLEENALPKEKALSFFGGLSVDVLRDIAEERCELSPLAFDPGWKFGRDWESTGMAMRVRRMIWEEFENRNLSEPISVPWYLDSKLRMPLGPDTALPIYVGGSFEPNEFAFLKASIEPGMRVIDLGANWGLYTIFLAKAVGPKGEVIAFEPSRRELEVLRANVELNGLRNIILVEKAAGEKEGSVEIQVAEAAHPGQSTLGEFVYDIKAEERESVEMVTLDGYVSDNNVAGIDLIKMDIEGAEMRALKGAQATLERFHPPILLELMDAALAAQGSSAAEAVEFLESLGYAIFRFSETTGRPVPVAEGLYSDNIVAMTEGDATALEERVKAVFGP